MCQIVPNREFGRWLALAWLAAAGLALAQTAPSPPRNLRPDWRRIGNSSFDAQLASAATGPVDRVWFSPDGARLFIRTASGHSFVSEDMESWKPQSGLVEPGGGLYALDRQFYTYRGNSIIGEGILDVAISPADPDVLVAATGFGIWKSADGGLSWSGLNEGLPNLPVRKLLQTPSGASGTRVLMSDGKAFEWAPGEKQSWRPIADAAESRQAASLRLGVAITALALGKDYSYAGAEDGRIWVSTDRGSSWRLARLGNGAPVEAISVAAEQPRIVLAALGDGARVLRSTDAGLTWEDLTGNLPAGAVRGIAVDREGAAVYVATRQGVFFSAGDPVQTRWIPMTENLPPAEALDVKLDEAGNQVYIALEGYGVYAAPAPHRFWSLSVVNSADFSRRPAAPGSLLTVLGGRLLRAQAGLLDAPVLAAADGESQIQVPFEVDGSSTQLALELARGRFTMSVPVQGVSPAIFVDRDGSGLLLDAASGVLLDTLTPARASGRVQILATGLGRVRPSWPTGMVAPLEAPPAVIAKVRAYLDREPVEVTRATLAPGYIGFYLVEVQLSAVVNAGPGELYLEADGIESNRVRIDLAP